MPGGAFGGPQPGGGGLPGPLLPPPWEVSLFFPFLFVYTRIDELTIDAQMLMYI